MLGCTLDDYFNQKQDYSKASMKETSALLATQLGGSSKVNKKHEHHEIHNGFDAPKEETQQQPSSSTKTDSVELEDNYADEEFEEEGRDEVAGMTLDAYFCSKAEYAPAAMKQTSALLDQQQQPKPKQKAQQQQQPKAEKNEIITLVPTKPSKPNPKKHHHTKQPKKTSSEDVEGMSLEHYLGASTTQQVAPVASTSSNHHHRHHHSNLGSSPSSSSSTQYIHKSKKTKSSIKHKKTKSSKSHHHSSSLANEPYSVIQKHNVSSKHSGSSWNNDKDPSSYTLPPLQ